MFCFLSSLYILEISLLLDVGLVKIFSHSIVCHFVLLTVLFALQKLFNFMRSHLLIVDFSACTIGILFRKLFPVPLHLRLFTTFSSLRFSVSEFMLRSLIHLDLNCLFSGWLLWIYLTSYWHVSSTYWHPVRTLPFLMIFSFFHCMFLASLSKIRCSWGCGFISWS